MVYSCLWEYIPAGKRHSKGDYEMDINTIYNVWCEKATEDKDLIEELKSIKGNEEEIYEKFYRYLSCR